MGSLRGTRRTRPFVEIWKTLSVLLFGSAGYIGSLCLAQTDCGETQTTAAPIRVEDAPGVGVLRAALNCAAADPTGSGIVEANWVGHVSVDEPITIADGTFLSITGEDDLAEVHGDGTGGIDGSPETDNNNGTRLFEVSQGGGLTLSRLKLSGGSATGGGAIYSRSASIALYNCVFDGNVAKEGNGGAVWADGGSVTILGGEFLANNATRYGGAVHAADSSLVVLGGSRFEGNTAIGGGALYCGLSDVGSDKPAALCSITDAEFVSNTAARDNQESIDDFSYLDGGGAAMFLFASVEITDSVFSENYARLAGGALHGGSESNVSVKGCTFENNTSGKYGGAIVASSLTLGGSTQLTNSLAADDGGAVFGWDANGTIIFNDVLCTGNTAERNGGCLFASGRGIINDGTAMMDNVALNGGSILAAEGSDISVLGGNFTCRSSVRGGFLYAEDSTRVKITGGLISDNVATKRGAGLYCNGNEASDISIEGGTFRNNQALESGGAIALWGAPGLVTITGGTFENNKAIFYGGFVFVEVEASLTCEGAIVRGNSAGDQGGGIYGRQATWVNSSCDLIANESPQGAAIYLTNVKSATFQNHTVIGNLASGGSVVYVAASAVVAKEVTFESSVGLQEYSFNGAVQMDGSTTLEAENCVFGGWRGDAVVLNLNPANGSLVLDSCDFRGSSAVLSVVSPNSDAEIRNAVVSRLTFETAVVAVAGTLDNNGNSSVALVDRALDCSDSNACGAGECVDSALGVLCECLKGGECLNDGGNLSLTLKTPPAGVTYSPDTVSYELVVSSGGDGTTHAIWVLEDEGSDLALDVVPSSGVLPPGGSITVQVTGTAMKQDVGGNLSSSFTLTSVGSSGGNSSAGSLDSSAASGVKLDVYSTFYLCRAYEYAVPLVIDADDNEDEDDGIGGGGGGGDGGGGGVWCEQCSNIDGEEGVNCQPPGATKALLPIQRGYWRSSRESLVVHECLQSEACLGATEVSSSDDYCADGYRGPYCAVCTEGYGRGVSNTCHDCDNTTAHLLIAMGTLFSLVIFLLFLLAVVFLIGGLDAIDIVGQSVGLNLSGSNTKRPRSRRSVVPADHSPEGAQREPNETNSDRRHARPLGGAAIVGITGIEALDVAGGHSTRSLDVPARRHARVSTGTGGVHEGGAQANRTVEAELEGRGGAAGRGGGRGRGGGGGEGGKSKCGGFGDRVKGWVSRLPLDKIKILVVVWQILAVFSSITGVEFPASYSRFLSWISVVNLDIGNIFSASCVLPSANFYVRLLLTTLAPLVLVCVLVLTYHMAKRRAGIGSAGVIARRAAWTRHAAAGLFLTFLVFTSASTVAFTTFSCDDNVVEGESYLRADFSISCQSRMHTFFEIYAGLMILVYPIGIPVLYAAILWQNRELLNPCIDTGPTTIAATDESDGVADEAATTRVTPDAARARAEDGAPSVMIACITSSKKKGQTTRRHSYSPQEVHELEGRVEARRKHPKLVPSMFLWKDFGPDLYYFEVIECGRRMLLTGVLIFIEPHSATQAAMACIFAFGSIVGFELLRPHMDPTDSWLYRLGCVIIFLSNFLALLIKVDAGEAGNRDVFGGFMVAVNVVLVLAVLATSWFATQQSVDYSRDGDEAGESSLAAAKRRVTAEQYFSTNGGSRLKVSSGSGRSRPRRSWRGLTAASHGRGRGGVAVTIRRGEAVLSLAR